MAIALDAPSGKCASISARDLAVGDTVVLPSGGRHGSLVTIAAVNPSDKPCSAKGLQWAPGLRFVFDDGADQYWHPDLKVPKLV